MYRVDIKLFSVLMYLNVLLTDAVRVRKPDVTKKLYDEKILNAL